MGGTCDMFARVGEGRTRGRMSLDQHVTDASKAASLDRGRVQAPSHALVSSGVAAVVAAASGMRDCAERLSGELNVPCVDAAHAASLADELVLWWDGAGLALRRSELVLRADFSDLASRIKPANLARELLVRAAKLKDASRLGRAPVVVDATAGLGTDSFLLAAAGWEVHLFESDPVIAALLIDACERARQDPHLADIAARMHPVSGDSIAALPALRGTVDVVYLDPMFPERTKSAAVKKKFQLLHLLERPCTNQEELLSAALAAAPRKVVVKRPIKGPYLAGVTPSHSLKGKAVRFDCIVPLQPHRA